jgi:hypothetical protein
MKRFDVKMGGTYSNHCSFKGLSESWAWRVLAKMSNSRGSVKMLS